MKHESALRLALIGFCICASAAQTRKPAKRAGVESCGPLAGQILKCPQFGFTYKVPFGWVNRTREMQSSADGSENPQSDRDTTNPEEPENPLPQAPDGTSSKAATRAGTPQTLLAVFERPPGAPGEAVNSAVVIATEPREGYPQIKTAADYFGPISDVAAQRGLKALSDPYAFTVASKHLVREDFSAKIGQATIFQSSLVMIEKGKIVSFTFVGGSEDDVEELIDNLIFAASSGATHRRP